MCSFYGFADYHHKIRCTKRRTATGGGRGKGGGGSVAVHNQGPDSDPTCQERPFSSLT